MVIEFCFFGLLPPPKKTKTTRQNKKKKKKTSLLLLFISVLFYVIIIRCDLVVVLLLREKSVMSFSSKTGGWALRKIQNFYVRTNFCVWFVWFVWWFWELNTLKWVLLRRFFDNEFYDTRARWWVSQQQQSSSTPSFSFISARERRFEGIGTWAPIELFSLKKRPPRLRLRTGERRTKSPSRSLVYE